MNPTSKPGNSGSPSGDMVGADETGGEAVVIEGGVGVCDGVFVCVTEVPSEEGIVVMAEA